MEHSKDNYQVEKTWHKSDYQKLDLSKMKEKGSNKTGQEGSERLT